MVMKPISPPVEIAPLRDTVLPRSEPPMVTPAIPSSATIDPAKLPEPPSKSRPMCTRPMSPPPFAILPLSAAAPPTTRAGTGDGDDSGGGLFTKAGAPQRPAADAPGDGHRAQAKPAKNPAA